MKEKSAIAAAVGRRVYCLCMDRGMTLYELSKKSGVPKSTIQDLVFGRNQNPDIKRVEKMARALGMDLRDFFNHESFF